MRRRTFKTLARRIVMWAAGYLFVLSIIMLVISIPGAEWGTKSPQHGAIGLELRTGGILIYNWVANSAGPYVGTPLHMGEYPPEWWWPWDSRFVAVRGGRWALQAPLWMPAAGSAVLLASAWLTCRKERHRGRTDCVVCGYDLAGITGPCPECGGKT